ncbi:MAG: flagellar biosynthetic protein FliO [Pirellulaceae bacterium]|nr:flagellar biosynthetic protein FliO [Pirellulaceae bacterium]
MPVEQIRLKIWIITLLLGGLGWNFAAKPVFSQNQFVRPQVARELGNPEPIRSPHFGPLSQTSRATPANQPAIEDENVKVASYVETSRAPNPGAIQKQPAAWETLSGKLGQQFSNMDWQRMVASLAIVIGGYLALIWMLRLASPEQSRRKLPTEVVNIVGQTPFGPQRQLQLVRLGSKLVLLLVGPQGTQPIGEVTDPNEVEHLVCLCDPKARRQAARQGYTRKPETNQPNPSMEEFVRALQKALAKSGGVTEYEA